MIFLSEISEEFIGNIAQLGGRNEACFAQQNLRFSILKYGHALKASLQHAPHLKQLPWRCEKLFSMYFFQKKYVTERLATPFHKTNLFCIVIFISTR
jgi:hypothetical protein